MLSLFKEMQSFGHGYIGTEYCVTVINYIPLLIFYDFHEVFRLIK